MNEARPLDREAATALLEPLTEIVIRAGDAVLAVNRSAMKVDGKTDGSPVTEADLAADRIIAEGLGRVVPDIPSLSEERAAHASLPYKGSFFLIDPLDGTKEFVAGRDEFTVNLALVTGGTPLLGIVSAPALGLLWRGIDTGLIDGVGVNGSAYFARFVGWIGSQLQSGQLGTYAWVLVAGVLAVLGAFSIR